MSSGIDGRSPALHELGSADMADLLALCQAALPLDQFDQALIERRVLHDPGPGTQAIGLRAGGRLVGAMVGVLREHEAGVTGGLLLFAVEPALRRQGLATRLLGEIERRMQAAGAREISVGGSTPSFFWPGLDIRYTPAYCLLTRHGYRAAGDMRLNMRVDLAARSWDTAELEGRLSQQGIEVRRIEAGDRDPLAAWLSAHWSAGWQAEVMGAYQNDPISGFVALRAGKPCAFAVYNVEGFWGHFGPTGTEQAERGLGIATALFYRCMQDLRRSGLAAAEVVWVGPIPYYTRIADATANRAFWPLGKQL
jgi:GNAT superfamily N-acetyltransferase